MDDMDDLSTPVEGFSKDCEIENVDAIKKFIEAQEKEIQDQKDADLLISERSKDEESKRPELSEAIHTDSGLMNMIISESDIDISKKKDIKSKPIFGSMDKANGSMALSIGSKVEAKDFSDEWHPAEIMEVDYEDMEVLVHYEIDNKRHDEWISVSSPRLRPVSTCQSSASSVTSVGTVKPGPSSEESLTDSIPISNLKEEVKDVKVEDKPKLSFEVGERCLARWRDNRRFIATILNDLGDGNFEIVFDDGCHWTCNTSRLHKLRTNKSESGGTPDSYGAGPSNASPQTNIPYPAFHTHLFDPTRDYLGSKSERREMKRKLNIKEIFNIGQKRPKKQKSPQEKAVVERKPRVTKKRRERVIKLKLESEIKTEIKTELPDAVASIIGTLSNEEEVPLGEVKKDETIEPVEEVIKEEVKGEVKPVAEVIPKDEVTQVTEPTESKAEAKDDDLIQLEDLRGELDPVLEEEVKLEQFDKPDDVRHEEVIDRIKEAINKLEDGLNQVECVSSPNIEPKPETATTLTTPEVATEIPIPEAIVESQPTVESDETTKVPKVKKGKKLRLLREKKVKKQVEKVKNELELVRKQVDEMRQQMLNRQQLGTGAVMPESFLLPGEWCCRWVNGQPMGTVSEIECEVKVDASGKPPLPRRSVQVEDKRLPPGWTKHMVRRSFGHSAGKWDVVLVSPDNRRFHTKNEMRLYLENNPSLVQEGYEHALSDFGVHLKLARRMGWISQSADGAPLPAGTLSSTSPLVKRKKLSLKRNDARRPRLKIKKIKVPKVKHDVVGADGVPSTSVSVSDGLTPSDVPVDAPPLEDGYVYVGSLKVQIIENLLRCPAEGCFKNFRNNTLLQMHIKHYHRELRKMLGATPKVLDLAYARTMPLETETPKKEDSKIIKVKIPRPPKREEPKQEIKEIKTELQVDTTPITPVKENDAILVPRSQDSPKLRQALINKPVKRPRVLLPVRRPDPEPVLPEPFNEDIDVEDTDLPEPIIEIPPLDIPLDFESAISTHTVTKPVIDKKRKEKRRFALAAKSEEEFGDDWFGMNSDVDTRSSFPRSGTPDSKIDERSKAAAVSSESNEENKDSNMYMFTENGERIKIVHMKREEIINCHCGFREEDGLMVQCELCLCWQHALCHNIQRECDVPEKYTCSICLNPRRGRRSQRFLHDQDRMYEGLLPAGKPCESLRRSHELAGNLLRIEDALHALRVKYYVATDVFHAWLVSSNGERIKIVHMKREEIINCHCGFREEDGLMVQCELCLCWQHALCHNIQRECDVPEKYTCSICLNPRRGRRSQRFLHDQDRMYEGLLPAGKPCESLRRSHELAGNLLRIEDALHALRVKYYVATKKDHPKLYLWAKDWEQVEIQYTQEKLNSDYSDLNIMINSVDKENQPVPHGEVRDMPMHIQTPPSEEQEHERYTQRDGQLGSQSLLSGLLSSPGDASLDLPISTSELERLAQTVQEQEAQRALVVAPQPEPPIENAACRRQLLKHLQRCQALIDARLDSIEAQVAELESQDPSFEDDETAEFFPRTKQTVQMLMRDLETMEELGVIT
uniref:MBD domain-containing protein n=1 Tax=Heliothis virescens TaxID=7102 RepID=A0A2A4KA81_HELVI